MRLATFKIRSVVPTEVPPYFWTMRLTVDFRKNEGDSCLAPPVCPIGLRLTADLFGDPVEIAFRTRRDIEYEHFGLVVGMIFLQPSFYVDQLILSRLDQTD